VRPLLLRTLSATLALLGLAACIHTPVTLTVAEAFSQGPSVDALPLNPNLRYLRVSTQGRTALMVLGYVDPTDSGPIETWYSREGEVLRLQHGRLVGTAGLAVDWRAVRYTGLPAWPEMAGRAAAEFERQRDEMPGYRFNVADKVALRQVRAPSNAALAGLKAADLVWYEETVLATGRPLPSARYGLRDKDGVRTVVYGEQCLSAQFCMSWQTWPAQP
jgi:hypothetical protein